MQIAILGPGKGEAHKMKKEPFCIEKRYDMIDAQWMMKEPGVDDAITKVLVKMKMNSAIGHSDLAERLTLIAGGLGSSFSGLDSAQDPIEIEVVLDSLATISAICVLCMVKVGHK